VPILEVFLVEKKEVGNSASFGVWLHRVIVPLRRPLPTKDDWLVISIVTVFVTMFFYRKGWLIPSPTKFFASYDMP
jgi:hypothetical protein